MGKQFNDLKVQQKLLKDQLQGLMDKFQREVEEGQTIHNIQEQQKKIINEWVNCIFNWYPYFAALYNINVFNC